MRPLAAVALAVLVLAGCGGDPNAPSRNLREDDQRWVEGALPRAEILPEGWTGTADDRGAALDDCEALDRSGLELTGEAVASVELGEMLAAIAGTQLFADEEDARAFVAEPSDEELTACLEEELAETFGDEERGAAVDRLAFVPSAPPDAGESARAATGEGTYTVGETRSAIALEAMYVQRDRAVLTLVTAALDDEFPEDVRATLLVDFEERTQEKPPPP